MNRRAFMQMLSGMAAFTTMPAVVAATRAPRTVAELEAAIEGLYAGTEDMAPKAFEEFVPCRMSEPPADWPVYRMVPAVWRRRGKTEAELVEAAWDDMQEATKGFETATLYWRKRPDLVSEVDFDSNERVLSLRFRFAILPADWIERARRNADAEQLRNWRRWFVPEGYAMGRVAS